VDSVTAGIVGRVRSERRRRGWSAEQLEQHMLQAGTRFPRSVIANLENNRRNNFPIEEIVTLAKVFGTTVNWLVWGTGVACVACSDRPPDGFTCNDCGRSTSIRVAQVLDQRTWFDSYISL
jgi:transcriptional regulator with XRE-family HTH domain